MADAAPTPDELKTTDLRLRAEAEFIRRPALGALSMSDIWLHELRVHQIELEMQNDELKRTQVELEESRARYLDLYDKAPVGYCTLTEEGVVVEANFAAARLLDLPRSALPGTPISRFIDPPDQDRFYLCRKQVFDSGEGRACELRMLRADGTTFWAHLEATAPWDGTGEHLLRVVVSDESGRIQAAEALCIAAAAFESVAGMLVTDANGNILKVNEAFTQITGYSQAEVAGQNPRMMASGLHEKAFYAQLWGSVSSEGSWQGEIWNRRKNGEVYAQWLSINAVRDGVERTTHYVGTFNDLSARKQAETEIRKLAFNDPLTGLPNRRFLMELLEKELAAASRHERKGALLFIDIDNFKDLNDTLGHDKGDLLLRQMAQRLLTCTREGDCVARLGGDEFVVLLEGLSPVELEAAGQARVVAEKALATLGQTYHLTGHDYFSSVSIGITLFGGQHEAVGEPLKRADLAMYQAKAAGRNALRFFDSRMQTVVTERAQLEASLREGLKKGPASRGRQACP